MPEDFDGGIHRAINREVGGVEAGSTGCDNERRCLTRAIGGIAAGDRVDLTGCLAARGAEFIPQLQPLKSYS